MIAVSQRRWNRQRRFNRILLSVPVQYRRDGKIYSDQLVEISEGGLRLKGDQPLPLMSEVKLFVPLPSGRSARPRMCLFSGRVVWRSLTGVGVEFVDPSIDSLRELGALLRRETRR